MPTPTYDLIASSVLTSSASSVTFDNISQDYRDLVLVVDAKPSSSPGVAIGFNSDFNSNYHFVQMYGNGTSAASLANNASYLPNLVTLFETEPHLGIMQVMDYSSTDKHKTVLGRGNQNNEVSATAGRWASTSAVTSLQVRSILASFAAGSTFYLYGIAG